MSNIRLCIVTLSIELELGKSGSRLELEFDQSPQN